MGIVLIEDSHFMDRDQAYQSAESFLQAGNYHAALQACDLAIERDSAYFPAYLRRGAVYAAMKRYTSALLDYNKVIELQGDYAPAYYNRGNAFRFLRRYESALADYT